MSRQRMPDRVGERVDLGDGGDPTLAADSLPAPLIRQGLRPDQLVIHGRLHDGFEQPVRLGDGRLGPGGPQPFSAPLADARSGDLVQVERAEGRKDVSRGVPVQILGVSGQLPLLDPLLGVGAEVDRARVRVTPVTPARSRLDPATSQISASFLVSKVSGAGRITPSGPG